LRSKDNLWREKIKETTKKVMSDPSIREKFERGIKRRGEDPSFRLKLSVAAKQSYVDDPDRAKQHSIRMKLKMSDKNFHSEFTKKQNTPEIKAFRKMMAQKRWSVQENHDDMSRMIKQSWASGQTGHGTPEWIAKQSVAQRNVWDDDNYRSSRTGLNNPMSGKINPWWQPWMTKQRSSIKWANAIRNLCGRKCMICDTTFNVEAHHIAPKACHPDLIYDLQNGIALCSHCHDGSDNDISVHKLLKNDVIKYEMLMRELLNKRDDLLYEHSTY
jgi:5-methylcytosine-specific restriction endonuclease McrA